jgi:hypothetical protein
MDPAAAQLLVGAGLSAVGTGIVFATSAPEDTRKLGLALTVGFGIACLLVALLLLFR